MYVYDPNIGDYVYYPDVYVPQQYSIQEFVPQAIYTALSLSVFAQALGLMVVASGFAVPPAELVVGDPAIEELRKAYGDEVVSKALTDVPGGEALELARRVEYYVHQDLRERYGQWAADTAIEAAPPGDLRTAQEIARTLSDRNVTKSSPAPAKARAVATGRMKGRSLAEPQRDTKTGIVYQSKYKAASAVAMEYQLNPANSFVWYKIKQIDPDRFVPA